MYHIQNQYVLLTRALLQVKRFHTIIPLPKRKQGFGVRNEYNSHRVRRSFDKTVLLNN